MSPAKLGLRTESYIILERTGVMDFPVTMNITLQNVIGCQPENDIPLLTTLLRSPTILNAAVELETAPILINRGCDFVSSETDDDVTLCVFICYGEFNVDISPKGVQGFALRLRSLEELGAAYGVCDITG